MTIPPVVDKSSVDYQLRWHRRALITAEIMLGAASVASLAVGVFMVLPMASNLMLKLAGFNTGEEKWLIDELSIGKWLNRAYTGASVGVGLGGALVNIIPMIKK